MNLDEAYDLAYQVMDETGCIDDGWEFEFDNAENRLGACHYTKRKITLSAALTELNNRDVVLETLLHEIAHVRAGHDAAHGHAFVVEARKLGIPGDAVCASDGIQSNPPRWKGTCPECGWFTRRWRMTNRIAGLACGPCCKEAGGYRNRFQLQWTKEY